MDLKTVEGCSLSMDTPSPDSAADSMTGLKQNCDLVHRSVTTQARTLMKFTTDSPLYGVVLLSHLSDCEWRQENAMEPISATVVIVALVALAC